MGPSYYERYLKKKKENHFNILQNIQNLDRLGLICYNYQEKYQNAFEIKILP